MLCSVPGAERIIGMQVPVVERAQHLPQPLVRAPLQPLDLFTSECAGDYHTESVEAMTSFNAIGTRWLWRGPNAWCSDA